MIITVGRQHGSNGRDIAKKLSEIFEIPCYDKEILDETAMNSNFSKEVIDTYDEKRVLPYLVAAPQYANFGGGFHLNTQVASAQFDAVKRLAERGDCVFVGRCADYVLRNRPDLVKVFIHADYSFRVKTIMERKDLSEEKAKKLIKEVDRDRSSYYRYYTDQTWGDADNYELSLDSSRVGVDGAACIIKTFVDNLTADNAIFR